MNQTLYLLFILLLFSCKSVSYNRSFHLEKSACLGDCLAYSFSFDAKKNKKKATLVLNQKKLAFTLSNEEEKKLLSLLNKINWQALNHYYGRKGETDQQKIRLRYYDKLILINGKKQLPNELSQLVQYLDTLTNPNTLSQ